VGAAATAVGGSANATADDSMHETDINSFEYGFMIDFS
jgi:hypothetical protein